MSSIRLQLFGAFDLRTQDDASIKLSARKSQALLAYLAMPSDKVHARDHLAAMLWSEQSTTAARTNLRQALFSIRKLLAADDAKFLTGDGNSLSLDSQLCNSDAEEFEASISQGSMESLQRATSLYGGDFLGRFEIDEPEFDEWAQFQRQRLREKYVHALRQLLAHHESKNEYPAAIDIATQLLSLDGLQESVQRTLMRSYAALGRRKAAQQQYEQFRVLLMAELGLKPEEQTRQLHHSILSQAQPPMPDGDILVSTEETNEISERPVSEESAADNQVTVTAAFERRQSNDSLGTLNNDTRARRVWLSVTVITGGLLLSGFLFKKTNEQPAPIVSELQPKAVAVGEAAASRSEYPIRLTTDTLTALGNKPSIAVLPFSNTSNEPHDVYFSDGLSEDLITELSRVSGLRVVARRSSFFFREGESSNDQISDKLGVRFILDGSVRREGDRVRINASLIDTHNDLILWADRYDEQLADVLSLQDKLTTRIVRALSITLTESEEKRMIDSRVVNPVAYDLLLRGLQPFRDFTAEGNVLARQLFTDAVDADPSFARAHANLALTYGRDVVFRYTRKNAMNISLGLEAADTALSLDPDLPQTQFALAVLSLADRQHDDALSAARRSVYLDPNYADGYAVLAQALSYGGLLEESLFAIRSAKLLNPLYPFGYLFVEGHIRYLQGEYEKALPLLREVVDRNADFTVGRLVLAANYAQLGLLDDAQWQLFELAALDSRITLDSEISESMYKERQHRDHLVDGLRKAGLGSQQPK